MRLTCTVRYETAPGESLEVDLDGSISPMTWIGDGWWWTEVVAYRGAPYRYRVGRDGAVVAVESGWRTTPVFAHDHGTAVDRWRDPDPERPAMTSALFRNAVAARHGPPLHGAISGVSFSVLAPAVPPGHRPGVIGSVPALGEWDQEAVAVMQPAPFPWWRVSIPATAEAVAGASYKMVLVDAAGAVVRWEPGANRLLPANLGGSGPVLVADDHVAGLGAWRGAGVALPVFSLRTARSVGVGQFTDLIPLVDWAADAGLSIIQLLPVNDTVKTHDWADCYPYDVTSVRALHPMYLDLDALGITEIAAAVSGARAELDPAPEIDFVRMMETKLDLARRAYGVARAGLDSDPGFLAFVDDEWDWLGPHSMWSTLRDRFGTPDHSTWPDHQRLDPAALQRMSGHRSPDHEELQFHWWLQYHLHRQLAAAAAHARRRGIALKGDLPIGVAPVSAEVWAHPEFFHRGTQAGAPPDAFAVRGQNWGFPTYDWEAMSGDGFSWWRARFRAMAAYADAYRIDHVLGFFRIWEIPPEAVDGLLGRFRPCLPLSATEVTTALGDLDPEPLLRPFVDTVRLAAELGEAAAMVRQRFFRGPAVDLRFVHPTQVAIAGAIAGGGLEGVPEEARPAVRRTLLDLVAESVLLEVGDGYQPRISWEQTERYRRLTADERHRVDRMAEDFFHRRHDEQWETMGRLTLPAVLDATDMLACGEDLGMVPSMVPRVMNEFGLLGLEIERMPKALGAWISDPGDAPYLSVVSPGTHDTSPLVEWWEEDPEATGRYWREALGRSDPVPEQAGPDLIEAIVRRHLDSPAMLAVLPLSDLLALERRLRRTDGLTERVNQPADRHHHWVYRIHLTVEDLIADTDFTERVRLMVTDSGR